LTACSPMHAVAFLRRAFQLAGMLAVIGGILGMHGLSGPHSMSAFAAGPGMDMVQASATVASPAAGVRALDIASVPSLSCPDAGRCAAASPKGAACVPSPGNPPPAVLPPGVTPFAVTGPSPASAGFAFYPYLPGSPSPCELGISRT